MDDAIPFTAAGSGRRRLPDWAWEAARRDYLSGLSGPEICARYGVGQSTLRKRARAGGWRREDQPGPDIVPEEPFDEGRALEARVGGDLDKIDYCQLAAVAVCRMMRAVLRGEAVEALRWSRVSIAMDAHQEVVDQWVKDVEAAERIEQAARAADLGDSGDSGDSIDPVFINGVQVRL